MSHIITFSPGTRELVAALYAKCHTKQLEIITELIIFNDEIIYDETLFVVTNLLTGDVHKLKSFLEAVKKYNELR